MAKFIMLVFFLLITVALATGYYILTDKISAGREQIALGEKRLANGKVMLAQGRARLANGKRRLSNAKDLTSRLSLGAAIVSLPVTGVIYLESQSKISSGEKLVANGAVNIKKGEQRLNAGEIELSQGKERLRFFNNIRIACGIGAFVFALLSVFQAIYWRRSFAK